MRSLRAANVTLLGSVNASYEEIAAEEMAVARGYVRRGTTAVIEHSVSAPLPELPPYEQYLQSEAWQAKREEAFAHYGRRCTRCGSEHRLQVHHRSYVNLGDEPMSDLDVLCKGCHFEHHRNTPVVIHGGSVGRQWGYREYP